jgi:recombinational DNA repair protein (RecF pathway)
MKRETADLLLNLLTNVANGSYDNKLKISALETALQEYDPELYQHYQKALTDLRQKDAGKPAATLLDLHTKLLQE